MNLLSRKKFIKRSFGLLTLSSSYLFVHPFATYAKDGLNRKRPYSSGTARRFHSWYCRHFFNFSRLQYIFVYQFIEFNSPPHQNVERVGFQFSRLLLQQKYLLFFALQQIFEEGMQSFKNFVTFLRLSKMICLKQVFQ